MQKMCVDHWAIWLASSLSNPRHNRTVRSIRRSKGKSIAINPTDDGNLQYLTAIRDTGVERTRDLLSLLP